MRKGQAGMEFLSTYGWAIMMAIIVISVMAYFGVPDTEHVLPEFCSLSPGLTCLEHAASAGDDIISLGIQNNMAKDITWLNLTLVSPHCTNTPITLRYTDIENGFRLLRPGEQGVTEIPCANLAPMKIRGDLTITYQLKNEEVAHTILGEFRIKTDP